MKLKTLLTAIICTGLISTSVAALANNNGPSYQVTFVNQTSGTYTATIESSPSYNTVTCSGTCPPNQLAPNQQATFTIGPHDSSYSSENIKFEDDFKQAGLNCYIAYEYFIQPFTPSPTTPSSLTVSIGQSASSNGITAQSYQSSGCSSITK